MGGLLMSQGLRGLVGQGMDGRKSLSSIDVIPLIVEDITVAGSGVITAPVDCFAFIWAGGASGSGAWDSAFAEAGGGGGGSALSKKLFLVGQQQIQWVNGAKGLPALNNSDGKDGTDTVLILPGGRVLVAGAGEGGKYQGAGGAGGIATGGDINRSGGAGGVSGGASGAAGEHGGAGGGTTGAGGGGGGGGAGFDDLGFQFGGAGTAASLTAVSTPSGNGGGSGGGGTSPAPGTDGRIFVVLMGVNQR
jgi:hypothetical protein